MRLGRAHGEAVDGKQVLWARGKCYNAVHRGTKGNIAAWRADRRPDLDLIAVDDRNIHEKVERCRDLRRREAQFRQRSREIVGAVVVMLGTAKHLISPAVAC